MMFYPIVSLKKAMAKSLVKYKLVELVPFIF